MTHRRRVRRSLGVSEGAFGKRQGLVGSSEHPERDRIKDLRYGAGIVAEPIAEIGMPRLVVEFDGLLKMLMGGGKVAEIKAADAGNAVRNHSLGTIRPGHGFAQEELRDFAHWCGFAAV
jgi:hypothetical protein